MIGTLIGTLEVSQHGFRGVPGLLSRWNVALERRLRPEVAVKSDAFGDQIPSLPAASQTMYGRGRDLDARLGEFVR
jgi:hypothetical protein